MTPGAAAAEIRLGRFDNWSVRNASLWTGPLVRGVDSTLTPDYNAMPFAKRRLSTPSQGGRENGRNHPLSAHAAWQTLAKGRISELASEASVDLMHRVRRRDTDSGKVLSLTGMGTV